MGTLHIVHVVTRLLRGGSEENVIATCLGQAERGYRVTLVHGRDHESGYGAELGCVERVESLVQPIDPVADVRATRQMKQLFEALRPDIVHTHQSKAGVVGRVAARLAGVPHVVHGVHIAPFVNVNPAERAMYVTTERVLGRLTHAFISVSSAMRDAYLRAGIGTPAKHHVVYSGMPIDAFVGGVQPENWRALAGVEEGAPKPPILLMLAALEPRKRHRELIEVFGGVVEHFPDVRLLCAGDGPQRPDVEAAIARAGLQDNVRLIGFHPEPARLVALADACLLTSMREGLPRVAVQYIAGGKPVIVTRLPGIDEVVEDRVSGLITDPTDMSDTARAIIEVLSDATLRARLAAGAAAKDVGRWRTEALVKGTEKVYAGLLAQAAG